MRAIWALVLTAAIVFVLVTQRPADTPAVTADTTAAAFALAPAPAFPVRDRRDRMATAFAAIDRRMADYATTEHIPGLIWGIVIDEGLAHVGVSGLSDVERKAPVTPESIFRIASMTKSFTAMAILKLRDEERLSLDDPVERYVPELRQWRGPTDDAPRITLRHLLSHSAGFPEDNPWGDQQLAVTEDEFTAMLARGMSFSTAPGTAYEYSNYGFAILGRVISRVAGVPYRQYIQREILDPLGMTATTLEPARVNDALRARGYRWEDAQWKEEPPLPDGAFGAMGGMLTSMSDLSRYVATLLSAWPARSGTDTGPVRRASLREMQQVARTRPASVSRAPGTGALQLFSGGYGYGLRISQTCDFGHVVAHGGGLPGFGSVMQWLPDSGVGIIVFGNRTYAGFGGVANEALAALASTGGLVPRQFAPSPALQHARSEVLALLEGWRDDRAQALAAVNLFRDRAIERRRAEFVALHDAVGSCRDTGAYLPLENPLRGVWTLECQRGTVRAEVTLAPTVPPLVQHLEVAQVPPGSVQPAPTCAAPTLP
ncbi:MAG: beta-lactamase family protein [Acidobacteria bacterium]|nr:beta-lactamase family protein [Acidobacteriota bacterium]